jgi:hypothetical protein
MVMLAFEVMNSCQLEVRIRRIEDGEQSDLSLALVATARGSEIGEVPPLASVNVTCSAMNLRTLDAAVLAALYRLDFAIAQNEFDAVAKKSA